jgi:hypothetical protein
MHKPGMSLPAPIQEIDIKQLLVEYPGADKEKEFQHAVITLANKLNEVIKYLNNY